MADEFTCDPCLCETAAKVLCSWDEALLNQTLTPTDYQALIAAGITLTCTDGSSAQTITIGHGSTMGGSVGTGFIPYASAPSFLANSWLKNAAGGVTLTTGKTFGSDVAGQTIMSFGAGGDSFFLSTDNGGFSEAGILMTTTALTLMIDSSNSTISMTVPSMVIAHRTLVSISGNGAGTVAIKVGETGLVDIGATTAKTRVNLNTYANDAAAGAAGLTTGMLYRTTVSGVNVIASKT